MSERFTAEELAKHREIAEAATPGPWSIVLGSGNNVCTWVVREHEDGSATFIADCLPEDDLAIEAAEKDHRPNMRHIAAFDPPTVLALLAEIERLWQVEEAARKLLDNRKDVGAGDDYVYLVPRNGDVDALEVLIDGARDSVMDRGQDENDFIPPELVDTACPVCDEPRLWCWCDGEKGGGRRE